MIELSDLIWVFSRFAYFKWAALLGSILMVVVMDLMWIWHLSFKKSIQARLGWETNFFFFFFLNGSNICTHVRFHFAGIQYITTITKCHNERRLIGWQVAVYKDQSGGKLSSKIRVVLIPWAQGVEKGKSGVVLRQGLNALELHEAKDWVPYRPFFCEESFYQQANCQVCQKECQRKDKRGRRNCWERRREREI